MFFNAIRKPSFVSLAGVVAGGVLVSAMSSLLANNNQNIKGNNLEVPKRSNLDNTRYSAIMSNILNSSI